MKTAISNPYDMEAPPKERTPIRFKVGADRARCHGCGRTALPRIIDTKFLSKPLAVCPHCNSVIQDPPAKGEPKKPKRNTEQFVWKCRRCSARYPEDARLPIDVTQDKYARRVCPECSGVLDLEPVRPWRHVN